MKKYFSFFLFWFVLFALAQSQNVQWASRVIEFSSQAGEKAGSAQQVLGKPNVLPRFYDSPCSWTPFREENVEGEWIKVEFAKAMSIRQIAIAENHNPGAVSHIYVFDITGKEHSVYRNDSTRVIPDMGRMLRVKIPLTAYKVKSLKLVLNTKNVMGWNQIDAIGISDSDTPIEGEINLVKDLVFDGKPQNLGTGINSRYDEIMPVISPDGKTLYFDRKDHPENSSAPEKVNDDIWFSIIETGSVWSRATNVGSPLNNDGHNFLAAISPDGNMALLGNIYEADGSMTSGVSLSTRKASGWTFPERVPVQNYFNRNRYSEFHMGTDSRTIVMAIERDDCQGGKDLYVCFKKPDGLWTEPQNLGTIVNSAGTEMSPFLAADGKTLYFSSNGFSGYGGQDMFLTRRLDDSWKNWSEPQNLGTSINSAAWDAYYSIPASGEYAYFSSEAHSIGKTDIFRIRLPKELKPDPVVLVSGKVMDEKSRTPIEAEIVYEDLVTGEEIGTATSNPLTGEYKIVLPGGRKYGFRAKAPRYLSVNENLDLTHILEYEEMNKDLFLVPVRKGETVILNNIFFSPQSAELTKESKPELNRVVEFMKENPTVTIEICGHTDNSCSEDYCSKLSTERARSVANFVMIQGIPKSRLSYRGYGSRKPIADNNTKEGKQKNRRVEFTIIGI